MLTMRPWCSLSMRRRHALVSRNTAERLTFRVCSQSSLFMRRISASRAMPALLTRIVGSPSAAASAATSESVDAGSPAFQTAPRPRTSASRKASLIRAAPSSEVAVPTTKAPAPASRSAIARPIPREAPVTSARSFSSMHGPRHGAEPGAKGFGVLGRVHLRATGDAAVQARKHPARTAFDQDRSEFEQRLHGLLPAHRAGELSNERAADIGGIVMTQAVDRADVVALWRAHLELLEALGQALRGSAHQARMRRYAHGQQLRAPGPSLPARCDRTLDCRQVPRDHDLPGRIVVDRLDYLALRGFEACRLDLRILEPQDCRHSADALRDRTLHQLAAVAHQLHGVFELQHAGAHQGRKLAETVPGHRTGSRPTARAPDHRGRDTRDQHRRLRMLGAVESLRRTLRDQLPQIEAQPRRCARVALPHQRMLRGERRHHAHGLRNLSREYQCDRHVAADPCTCRERGALSRPPGSSTKKRADYNGFGTPRGWRGGRNTAARPPSAPYRCASGTSGRPGPSTLVPCNCS